MRPLALVVLALLVFAAPGNALEAAPAPVDSARVSPASASVTAERPDAPAGEMQLERVRVDQRESADQQDAAAQWPQRGSFWWLVGVVVVAGVILAVLL